MDYINVQDGKPKQKKYAFSNSILPSIFPKRTLRLPKSNQSILFKITESTPQNKSKAQPISLSHQRSSQVIPMSDVFILNQKLQLYESINKRKKFFQEYIRSSLTPERELQLSVDRMNIEDTKQELLNVMSTPQKSKEAKNQLTNTTATTSLTKARSYQQSKVNSPYLRKELLPQIQSEAFLTGTPSLDQSMDSSTINYPHQYSVAIKKQMSHKERIEEMYSISSYQSKQYATRDLPVYKKQRSDLKKYNDKMIEKTEALEKVMDDLKDKLVKSHNKQDRLNKRINFQLNLNRIIEANAEKTNDKEKKRIQPSHIWRRQRFSLIT